MGYNICMTAADIFISVDKKKDALKALKKALPGYLEEHSIQIFEDAMAEYGYEPEVDSDYNIIDIEHVFEKLRDDEMFWNALAPYVRSGGFIEMVGEDNEMWRWSFDNGKMKEQKPNILWEDC